MFHKKINMKSRKLLFTTLLAFGCIATYISLTSSASASQGVMGASATGCGSCHGNSASATTSITLTGIPASGYVSGTTYPVTLTISNATKTGAGFDLNFSGGSISNAPSQTMVMGTELHHTATKAMASGTVTWNFSWTAPVAASVTLNIAGNAVNGNNSDSGDEWNKVTINLLKATPTSVKDVENMPLSIYPNPSNGVINIQTGHNKINKFYAVSLSGSTTLLAATEINNGHYQINTTCLATGNYILLAKTDNTTMHAVFSVK
jgi:hypothetical protein